MFFDVDAATKAKACATFHTGEGAQAAALLRANSAYTGTPASTNVISPIATWRAFSTNPFDGSGNFIFTNPVNPGIPALFYLMQLQ